MPQTTDQFESGQHVAVTQQIPQANRVWTIQTSGEVIRFEQKKTGSWFAHAKDDKLWLDRLTIRKDDGELVTFNLDQYTHVETLPAPEKPQLADEPAEDEQASEEEAAAEAEEAPATE